MGRYPYGNAALVIFLLALISGVYEVSQPAKTHDARLVYWTFADQHYPAYKAMVPAFEAAHPGVTVDVELVSLTALASRLQSAMMSDLDVPDVFEAEIGTAGTFFRGPTKDIGLVDLTSRVHAPGPNGTPSLWDSVVRSRFTPYTDRGHIYGIPHDIHPVMIAYRRDIFEKAGIDLPQAKTWDQFIAIGHKMTIPGSRYMLEMIDTSGMNLETILLQKGGGYFDAHGNVIMDNDIAVQSMLWYVPLVAGPHKIASSYGTFDATEAKAIEDGSNLCFLVPDWRTHNFEKDDARVSGKLALMPLPTFEPGGRDTSTWGGSMIAITKHSKDQELAWQLAMYFYRDISHTEKQYRMNNILPPLKAKWKLPAFHERRPYWSNQKIGEEYMALADKVPPHYNSPVMQTATDKLGDSVIDCVRYYTDHGCPSSSDPQYQAFVRASLKHSADRVRQLIRRIPN
jgi:arabinosaccharide transport system substrate-binding protein